MKKLLKRLWLAALTTLLLMSYAFAYLDPATLTYVIQIVAGLAIAGTAAVGIFWKRIRLYFKKKRNKAQSGEPDAAPEAADEILPGVISDEELGLGENENEKKSGESGHDEL